MQISDNVVLKTESFSNYINLKYIYLGQNCNIYYNAFLNCWRIKYFITDYTVNTRRYFDLAKIDKFRNRYNYILNNVSINDYDSIYGGNSVYQIFIKGLKEIHYRNGLALYPVPLGFKQDCCKPSPDKTLLFERDFYLKLNYVISLFFGLKMYCNGKHYFCKSYFYYNTLVEISHINLYPHIDFKKEYLNEI